MIMQVHDELVLEVPESELDSVKAKVPELMSGVAKLDVPLVAEPGVGMNWEEVHWWKSFRQGGRDERTVEQGDS